MDLLHVGYGLEDDISLTSAPTVREKRFCFPVGWPLPHLIGQPTTWPSRSMSPFVSQHFICTPRKRGSQIRLSLSERIETIFVCFCSTWSFNGYAMQTSPGKLFQLISHQPPHYTWCPGGKAKLLPTTYPIRLHIFITKTLESLLSQTLSSFLLTTTRIP